MDDCVKKEIIIKTKSCCTFEELEILVCLSGEELALADLLNMRRLVGING